MTAEVEVLEFIATLVTTIKPRLVVETGSFLGVSTEWIARGLERNAHVVQRDHVACLDRPEIRVQTPKTVILKPKLAPPDAPGRPRSRFLAKQRPD